MRQDLIAATIAALLVIAGHAEAAERTAFTDRELQVIARNDLLQTLRERDPALVARILDMMLDPSAGPRLAAPSTVDLHNPDLAALAARSAEGSKEWLELVRLARARKAETKSGPDATRSAEGSLELLSMMRDARRQKNGGQ